MEPNPEPIRAARRRNAARSTAAQRARHLANWQASGLNGVEYSRASGVSTRNLYRWSGRARRAGDCAGVPMQAGSAFLSVDLPD